ncbi:class I SAM-dependent DNA methyltransferase [Paenibacillus cymbidii]|uniref:class I SAM-dependent DNA methyltransferase n=1 Tax=Paenibacillus cymbidii TaxID=1639034 RepID=UPI00108080D6|nr:class I SAM-dependent methyltransferase [Paenibacillus cymbidii]
MAYGQFAYWYDRLMEDMPYGEWRQWAEAVWSRTGKPRTVVDLGCGTGNVAIPLAEYGYAVTGIDLSEHMLAVAHDKASSPAVKERMAAAGGSVAWQQQDMRDWEAAQPADAVICFCDCLNYLLEEDDIRQAFARAYEALGPGGSFLFDAHTPRKLQEYALHQPFVLDEDDIAYIWTCELDETRLELEHQLSIFVRDGADGRFSRIEEMHVQRAYPPDWLARELARAGFRDVETFADFTFRPANERTERAFFVARK